MRKWFLLAFFLCLYTAQAQVSIGLMKYGGGGDWYGNPTSLPNLIAFCNAQLGMQLQAQPLTVEPGSAELFLVPFVHLTGHGNVLFTDAEIANLRLYLESGGFLHIDDNYGMDPYIRRELKKLFPKEELIPLPEDHPIFHQVFSFPKGLPKIHLHDNKSPQAFGLFHKGRMVVLYTYEADLGDGWEDAEVHQDPREVREKALRMGANILTYVFHGQH